MALVVALDRFESRRIHIVIPNINTEKPALNFEYQYTDRRRCIENEPKRDPSMMREINLASATEIAMVYSGQAWDLS